MPPRDDIVLWLDLECTGSSDDALVLEVGMALTGPGPQFDVIDTFMEVFNPGPLPPMDPVVVKMHTLSKLLDDIPVIGRPPVEGEHRMREWIDFAFGASPQHVIMAGSGVSHYDRKYIRRDWPWLDKRLAYYTYDVGVLRRFARMVGKEAGIDQSLTPHRALADVFQHIQEARKLLEMIR